MKRTLLVNVTPRVIRVALLEDGRLVELFLESAQSSSLVGNIYRGEVRKIIPGISSAFINIGKERDGFLFVDDIIQEGDSWEEMFGMREEEHRPEKAANIGDILRPGQHIYVQVIRDSLPNKGPRVTSHLALAGRYLVFIPGRKITGVSKKIDDGDERKRLRQLASDFSERLSGGVIVRTAGMGVPGENLLHDVTYLENLWKRITERGSSAPVPSLVHRELALPLRLLRDLAGEKIHQVIVDDASYLEEIMTFLSLIPAASPPQVNLYEKKDPLFEVHGIEKEIERALQPKVWLKSGGYLVINQTEALVAVDVNSGKYLGRGGLEQTAFKTNMEAAKEIVKQVRLRNLGGIIILDFIDMEKPSHRKKVVEVLEKELENDRAYSRVLGISSFGLVQMTRKRTKENIVAQLTGPCDYCSGLGRVKKVETVCLDLFNELKKSSGALVKKALVQAHPDVIRAFKEFWLEEKGVDRFGLMDLVFRDDPDMHREEFKIVVS